MTYVNYISNESEILDGPQSSSFAGSDPDREILDAYSRAVIGAPKAMKLGTGARSFRSENPGVRALLRSRPGLEPVTIYCLEFMPLVE